MNNNKELIERLGEIDTKYLDEYHERRNRRNELRKNIMRYGSIAAMFMLVIGLSVLLTDSQFFENAFSSTQFTEETTDPYVILEDPNQINDTVTHDKHLESTSDILNNNDPPIVIERPEISYIIPYSCDYAIPTDLASMLESVEVVLEGTYEGAVSTYVTEIGQVITVGEISNFKVIKGEIQEVEKIKISFYGGAITVSEFREQVATHLSEKYGINKLTREEAETKYIGIPLNDRMANPQVGKRYLIFLSFSETSGEYFVVCDGYGIREINNEGRVWNIEKSQFEEIYK